MFCLEAARGIATACSPADTNTVDGYEEADTPHAYAEMHYSVMFDARASRQLRDAVNVSDRGDSWLATLGDWSDALALHEEKLQVDANDMEAAVGCMRCYSANGDWSDVLDLANDYTILPSSQELADDRIVNSRRGCAQRPRGVLISGVTLKATYPNSLGKMKLHDKQQPFGIMLHN